MEGKLVRKCTYGYKGRELVYYYIKISEEEIYNVHNENVITEGSIGQIVEFELLGEEAVIIVDSKGYPKVKVIDWEEEMKKCSASPYYFYTNYMMIQTPEGPMKATTNLTEEMFNKLVQKYGKVSLFNKRI